MISNFISLLLMLAALDSARVTLAAILNNGAIGEDLRRSLRQTSGSGGRRSQSEVISPCPEVLSNVRIRPDGTRWSGLLTYTPEKDSYGVVVEIELDKPVNFLGSTLAEVNSNDSITHIIRDDNYQLEKDDALRFQVLAQYSSADDPPRVKTINFNGKQICPAEEDFDSEPPFVSPDIIPTISPSPSTVTSSPPVVTEEIFDAMTEFIPTVSSPRETSTSRPQDKNVDITVTTVSSTSSIKNPPPKMTQRKVTTSDQYEISGNFKIYSNTSLVVLLAARPPTQGSSEEESEIEADDLTKLIAQVFNTNPESGSGPTVVQVLPNGKGDKGKDEVPPLTTGSRMQPGGVVAGNNRLGGRTGDPAEWNSPCEGVFSYLTDSIKSDTWYGVLTLISKEEIRGIRLDFELDKPPLVFGAWLGEATTMDKKLYTVWNPWADLEPDEMILVRIFAKYEPNESDPPKIKSVRFNGRRICPA